MRFFTRRSPKSPAIALQGLGNGVTPSTAPCEQPPRRLRIRSYFKSLLPKLRLPAAVLMGASITALTTFALVRHVQHEIANARVSADPKNWMQIARTEAYDACYYGCNDCDDNDWAYNACKMTARANVTGVICDGNRMWNWAERYPIECLKAVGEFYKAIALRKLKQTYRNQLAVIILTVLAGIIGAVVTYAVWGRFTTRHRTQDRYYPSSTLPAYRATDNGPSPPPYSAPVLRGSGRSAGRIALIITALTSVIGRSQAFPCTGYDPKADQYFINANKTLYGVVHGWFSNCYTYTCACTTSCSGGDGGINGAPETCSTTCSTCTASNVAPITYVNATLSHVEGCGFQLVDAVDGNVNLRVANPLFEKDWRVKISVNAFNLTDVTDPSIFCLHDFANSKAMGL